MLHDLSSTLRGHHGALGIGGGASVNPESHFVHCGVELPLRLWRRQLCVLFHARSALLDYLLCCAFPPPKTRLCSGGLLPSCAPVISVWATLRGVRIACVSTNFEDVRGSFCLPYLGIVYRERVFFCAHVFGGLPTSLRGRPTEFPFSCF